MIGIVPLEPEVLLLAEFAHDDALVEHILAVAKESSAVLTDEQIDKLVAEHQGQGRAG